MAHQTPKFGRLKTVLVLMATFATLAATGCSSSTAVPTEPAPPDSAPTATADGIPACTTTPDTASPVPAPIFPTIFDGAVTRNDRPLEDGIYILACLGTAGTGAYSLNPAKDGAYADLVVGTQYQQEVGQKVTFLLSREQGGDCLRNTAGNCLQATQTPEFEAHSDFNVVGLNLTFYDDQ